MYIEYLLIPLREKGTWEEEGRKRRAEVRRENRIEEGAEGFKELKEKKVYGHQRNI